MEEPFIKQDKLEETPLEEEFSVSDDTEERSTYGGQKDREDAQGYEPHRMPEEQHESFSGDAPDPSDRKSGEAAEEPDEQGEETLQTIGKNTDGPDKEEMEDGLRNSEGNYKEDYEEAVIREYDEPGVPEIKAEPNTSHEQMKMKRVAHSEDEELEKVLATQRARIKVVGSGGAGNNTINRITEVGIAGVESIGINTDAQDLLYTNADKKLLLGREVTKGLGAGSNPKIGEEAARESDGELKKLLQGADMVFITCGLGGGTGTGSAPVVAEIAKKLGALTVGVVTIPFAMEGKSRYDNALTGLEKMEQVVDTLIVIPNDKLLELAPDLPINTAFKVADEILTNAVKGIAELITVAGLVNLDFADVRAIMGNGGVALIGTGESDTDNRAIEAVEKAISNPLLDVDIRGANGALINVAGGPDMTLEEARQVVEKISELLDDDARVIWGAQIHEDLQKTIRAMLIVTGVSSNQIFGSTRTLSSRNKEEIERELGIEFVN